jgi:alpha-tubulin suppressor-like RCC1 family protein
MPSFPPLRRSRCPARVTRGLWAAAVAFGALACERDDALTGPDLKAGNSSPALTASPSSLEFLLPGATPATLTVTSQLATQVTATISTPCVTVVPPSAVATKGTGNSPYTATFTVEAASAGDCTITLTDKKGRQAQVAVSVQQLVVPIGARPIVASLYHTCALGAGGVAYCWGDNDNGRLGDGTTTDRPSPGPVAGEVTFTSLTAGPTHTCGLSTAGQAWCWGLNGFLGQLGNPGAGTEAHAPVAVAGPGGGAPLAFVLLTAGVSHTCGLTSGGSAWCWGRNFEGQLGDGSQETQPTPVQAAGTLTFATLTAEAHHTCGVTTDGTAYCWGLNDKGELGDGTTTFRTTPNPVGGELSFMAIGAGGGLLGGPHTCGVTGTNAAYCWGDNSSSQLGDGTATDRLVPTVLAGAAFSSLDAGQYFTCALGSAGAASCWGNNQAGQLGTGDFTLRSAPAAVVGPGGGTALSFQSITAGVAHVCGRTTDAAIYCWGTNVDGQLGQAGGGLRSSPTEVSLGDPKIADLTLESTEIPIGSSTFTNYRAVVANPGASSNQLLQGLIYQGDGLRAAGGTTFAMASGQTIVDFTLTASNETGGDVTLVPGPATFVLLLTSFDGATTWDSRSVPITLSTP